MANASREHDVFINLPFDSRHERRYIGLIAGLVGLGLNPRCVLEVPPSRDRLRRLVALIRDCRTSIHDLSEVRLSRRGRYAVPRFNMPFELGLAVAISDARRTRLRHEWRVMEAEPFRINESLSDLKRSTAI
ncbi:MAG: hypothetical protein HY047_05560 [Acidobacteria bacterium]|nr:hypothetical protein [Acidobacteriota bacterium]